MMVSGTFPFAKREPTWAELRIAFSAEQREHVIRCHAGRRSTGCVLITSSLSGYLGNGGRRAVRTNFEEPMRLLQEFAWLQTTPPLGPRMEPGVALLTAAVFSNCLAVGLPVCAGPFLSFLFSFSVCCGKCNSISDVASLETSVVASVSLQ